jgi:hypothetical protein
MNLPQIGDFVEVRAAVRFGAEVWDRYRVVGPETPRVGPDGSVWFSGTRGDNAPMPMAVRPALLRFPADRGGT